MTKEKVASQTQEQTAVTEAVKNEAVKARIPQSSSTFVVKALTEEEKGATTDGKSFVDTVYDQINAVIGGSNPNQFLCLTIPGQILSAEDFTYDYKNNVPKGPTIEANESRLANKLFDPCRMTAGDNGLTLPYQYKTALDMLTPKLNAKVANAKNQVRELLMTEYPYDFGDGSTETYTLQEVFFRLYDEWIEATQNWADEQEQMKKELKNKYPATSAEGNAKYNDAYLEWYETVAESRLNAVNEKFSKVLSVFSPNDMKILEGIMDSGSGAELQQARQTLNNSRKITPDGGYVYPVKFNPTNWFELLGTSFTPIDLLKSPDVLSTELQILSVRRLSLSSGIDEISAMIPEEKTVQDAKSKVDNAKSQLDEKKSSLTNEYGEGISSLIDVALDIAPLFAGGVPADIVAKLSDGVTLKSGQTIGGLIQKLSSGLSETATAQQQYVDAVQNLSVASAAAIEKQNLASLKQLLLPLKEQLDEINMKIQEVQTQIKLAASMRPIPDGETGVVTEKQLDSSGVAPTSVPNGYTQIVITASASEMKKATSSQTASSVSTSGSSFWFCGYHAENSSEEAAFSDFADSANNDIQIGMNIAKVGIEREWFNPGVFVLTKDMFNVTTQKIAPILTKPSDGEKETWLKAMADADSVFPCFPVAMVVARDITIKLVSQSGISSTFSSMIEKHASAGGGFLFFSGACSSSSSSSSSGVHVTSTSNTITLKFDTPQILGYYLEATAADKSVYLDDVSGDATAGYVSITQFVEAYKKMLAVMRQVDKQKVDL